MDSRLRGNNGREAFAEYWDNFAKVPALIFERHQAETFAKSRFNPEFIYISSYSGLTRVSLFLLKQTDT
ncbi:hypothetical protein, partial [Neisseria dentiae]